ncbi:ATP-binding protein [Pelagicoccus sp. SDUM812002]|uniref:ATP-binding protein n=1 Tax=Pelagicoccus sp. SDUM812002 TaxID=3041266 RepID=UPI0028108547|nr:ATP-binding protein [Pelagicoccus sp. SDUM812002]MDQ8184891.1 response regulator [Pelagicoccus sp. SDUM812002]
MSYTDPSTKSPLFNRFNGLSIRKKIVVLISAVAGFVTLVSMLVSSIIELTSFRVRLLEEYERTARMTASNLETSVSFRDEYDAHDMIKVLSQREQITCAIVYLVDGTALAKFRRENADTRTDFPAVSETTRISDGYITVNQPIAPRGNLDGYLVFKAEVGELNDFVLARIVIFLTISVTSLGTAIIIAKRVGKHVSQPIIELAETAERITKDHDFSTRQERMSDDETGKLVDAFNEMMAEIEDRSGALIQARDNAEASSRAKDDFLSVISHELRTPLNPIIGYVEILLRKSKEAEDRKQLGLVRQYAEHLQSLIDRVIDYSRFERGAVSLSSEPVDYQQLCQNVLNLMQQQAEEKGIALSCQHTYAEESIKDKATLSTDRVKLQQVLLNLVANALKFTKEGSIEIRTHLRLCEQHDACLRIEVKDTGIGIDEVDRERVFRPFSQIDVSLTRQYSGMGLGLAITQKIVHSLGGKIDFESQKSAGSTFWLEIPVNFTNELDLGSTENVRLMESQNSSKVLLVDDQIVNLELGEFMLSSSGHEVVCASSGQEAIKLASEQGFDLIILDIKMPKMNGYETARELRKLESDGKRTPIIAMTAHVTSRGNEECIEAGMDDSMSKPFNTERLNEIISKWLV